jgi:DNA-binding response OmpR family regulator
MSKILIVDGDYKLAQHYCHVIINSIKTSDCSICVSPEAALLKTRDQKYSLIVSEIRFSGMNGFQFRKEIAKRGYEIPTLFITSMHINRSLLPSGHLGEISFVQKPISDDDLIKNVQVALDYSKISKPKIEYLEPVAVLEIKNGISILKKLAGDYSIGRSEDNDIILRNPTISRHHCLLSRVFDRVGVDYLLIDYSSNSTKINGKRIEGYAELDNGDIIQIDGYTLTYKKISSNRSDFDQTIGNEG